MCSTAVAFRKFQYAYHLDTDQAISAEEAMLLKAADLKAYTLQYKDHLFCPMCKQARICLVRGDQQPFFRTCPKSVHADDCGLSQDELLPSEVNALVTNTENIPEIQRQMERVLSLHFSGNEKPAADTICTGTMKSDVVVHRQAGKRVSKYISQKNITAKFSEDDINVKKLFYGEVVIQWEKGGTAKELNPDGSNKNYMKLLIRTPSKAGTQRFICRLNISPAVFSHLSKNILQPSRYLCSIVFLSELSYPRGKDYLKGWLSRSEFLRIEKLKDP